MIIVRMAKVAGHPTRSQPAGAGAGGPGERDGGTVLAVYQEPVAITGISRAAPDGQVERPLPARSLPTHAKKLQEVVKKIDRFVDPVVSFAPGPACTDAQGKPPAVVLGKLKAKVIPAIWCPRPRWPSRSRAQHQKAHNLQGEVLE